jgi:aminopeptidase S
VRPQSAPQAALAAAPDISLTNQKAHLQQFQSIASANGNTRRSTTAGYTASVNYVFDKLTAAGFSVVRQNCTSGCTSGAGPNVIADWNGGGGDPNQVYMLGSHLDSVSAGPGINDNGSGSATVLEIALTLAAQNPSMTGHARFAWWTDEEQGLNGSEFYVNSLPAAERSKIKAYFNFDMVASTNGGYFINRITSAAGQTVKAYYDSIGVPTEENVEGAGRSDDASFKLRRDTDQRRGRRRERRQDQAQATKWGGTAGASYDPATTAPATRIPANISDIVLDRAGDAAAYALWTLAVGTTVSNDFSIAASPGAASVNPGGSTTTTVSTAVVRGTAETVTFSASGAPAGVSVAFSPSSVTAGGSATATITTTASAAPGTYALTLTGTSASATHSATFTLTVNGPAGCSATNGTDVQIPDLSTCEQPDHDLGLHR